jgi:hypothetical protein
MFRFSIAVHCSPEGKVTPLVVSDNADDAIQARNECDKPGEVGVILNIRPEKLRKNRETAVELSPMKDAVEAESAKKAPKKAR